MSRQLSIYFAYFCSRILSRNNIEITEKKTKIYIFIFLFYEASRRNIGWLKKKLHCKCLVINFLGLFCAQEKPPPFSTKKRGELKITLAHH